MQEQINELQKRIDEISERNRRVEADKAWETSIFRIVSVAVITYIIAVAVFYFIGADNIFRNALVPTAGFLLSVQTLPALKYWWIQHFLR